MQLDRRVMNVALDFCQLRLALSKCPLQLVLAPVQIIRRAPLKMKCLRRRIPSGLNRLCELGRCRLQKLKRRSVILGHRQCAAAVCAIDFHPGSVHIDREFSPAVRTIEDDVSLGHLDPVRFRSDPGTATLSSAFVFKFASTIANLWQEQFRA